MKRQNKKGFTIVELVIVIAVIAILAAVLIPTFSSVIKKAKISADTQVVRNLNTALATDSIVNGKPETMSEALEIAAEAGYDVAKINASAAGNAIVWDSANNVFCYINDGNKQYIPNTQIVSADNHQLWVISNKDVSTTYSTYYNGPAVDTLAAKDGLGLDTGKIAVGTVTYGTEDNAYNSTNEVTIRTNGGDLVVNAPNASVDYFSDGGSVNIIAIKDQSFHAYGKIDFVAIQAGRFVAEKTAEVKAVAAFAQVTVESVVADAIDKVYEDVADVEAFEEIKQGATLFAGGIGAENDPYLIETAEQFINIADVAINGTAYFKLIDNIDMSEIVAEKYYVVLASTEQSLNIDLGGKAIVNVEKYLFQKVKSFKLYNGSINFNCYSGVAGVVNTIPDDGVKNVEFDSIVLAGQLNVSSAHYGALVSYAFTSNAATIENDVTLNINKVSNNAKIINVANNAYTGGYVGYINGNAAKLSITNCVMNGSVQSKNAGGFVGGCSAPKGAVVVNTNNSLSGALIASANVQAFGLSNNYGKEGALANDQAVELKATASLSKIDISTTLIDANATMSSEIIVNHQNANVATYVVSVEYWVTKEGGAGGYPRPLTVTLDAEELGSINTGLFKCVFVQGDVKPTGDYAEINSAMIWKDGDIYRVYDEVYQLSNAANSKNSIIVTGYDASGIMITTQTVVYSNQA